MKYLKPPLSVEEQARLLISRGMKGDISLMVARLTVVNYYRLSGYWYNFRNSDDSFVPGTSFETVWNRYAFDRRLRLMAMDAVERIEIAIRTRLAYRHSHYYRDPFAFVNNMGSLPGLRPEKRMRLLDDIKLETHKSRDLFVEHFFEKYGDDHKYMPIWMATEVMTFGCILTLFNGVNTEIRREIAQSFNIHDKVLNSWLLALNTVRNICAHHGRLWNRELGTKPLIPERDLRWHRPVEIKNNRIFAILSISRYCLSLIAPQSGWAGRLKELLKEFPNIPIEEMEFPPNWRDSPIWKE